MNALARLKKLVGNAEGDPSLVTPERFRDRVEALDRLEAYDLDAQLMSAGTDNGEIVLYRRAIALRSKLEDANCLLYERIRTAVRRGYGRDALMLWTSKFDDDVSYRLDPKSRGSGESYNYLDELVSGVFHFPAPGAPMIELTSEMVAYQPTPTRHIFDLIQRIRLTARHTFIDLGSGLGHVALIVAACTQARAIGIELEPSYVESAQQCAEELNLDNATFLAQDVRDANLSKGNVFYLYTPFRGTILRAVLDRLRTLAATREIRVCTFGPCTPTIAAEPWLARDEAESGHISVFRSHP